LTLRMGGRVCFITEATQRNTETEQLMYVWAWGKKRKTTKENIEIQSGKLP